jgi:hypothetical protein
MDDDSSFSEYLYAHWEVENDGMFLLFGRSRTSRYYILASVCHVLFRFPSPELGTRKEDVFDTS